MASVNSVLPDDFDPTSLPVPKPIDYEASPVDRPVTTKGDDFKTGPVFGEQLDIAFDLYQPFSNARKVAAQPFYGFDEGFNIIDHPKYFDDVPEEYREDIYDSVSHAEAQAMHDKALSEITGNERIMEGGTISAGAAVVMATITDFTTLIGGAVEAKLLTGIIPKATRLARARRYAGVIGTEAYIQERIVAEGSSIVDEEDAVYAALGAVILGGSLGALSKPGSVAAHAQNETRRIATGIQDDMDAALLRGDTATLSQTDSVAEDIMGTRFETGEFDSVMAGQDVPENLILTARQDNIIKSAKEQIKVGKVNGNAFEGSRIGKIAKQFSFFDDYLQLYKMPGDMGPYIAHHLLESASGIPGRSSSAALVKHSTEREVLDIAMPHFRKSYRDFAKENGMPRGVGHKFSLEMNKKFNEQLYMELQLRKQADLTGDLHNFKSPHSEVITKLVDKLQDQDDLVLQLGKKAGIHGMENIKRTAGYIRLKWDGSKARQMFKTAGKRAQFKALLSKGYQAQEMPPEVADKIAHAVIRRATMQDLGLDFNMASLLSKDSRAVLQDILEESGSSVDEIAELFRVVDAKTADKGKANFAKQRVPIDLTVKDVHGNSLMQIVDTDVQTLMMRNGVEVSGRAALARKGIKSDGDWTALKGAAIQEASEAGATGAQIKHLTSTLDGLYDEFLGRPVRGGVNKNLRRLMDWSMITALGKVGFAQAAEMANVLAAHGIGAVLSSIPELAKARKAIKAGNLKEAGALGELKAEFGGLWGEELLYRPNIRLDDSIQESSHIAQVFDQYLATGKDFIGTMSGMNYIKTMEQQLVVRMQTDKVFKQLAKDGISDTVLKRFAEVGWNEKTLKKLKKQIDKGNVTFQPNGSVDRLNMEKWGDDDLVEQFGFGIHRHSNQIIQLNMIGENSSWMPTNVGGLLMQFRTFPLLAIQKQTLRQLRMGDMETAMQVLWGTAASTAVTLSKASLMDVGNTNEKKQMDELLTPQGMAKAGMQYMSMANVLPEGISFLGNMLGYNPLRGSGKAMGVNGSLNDIPAFGPPLRLLKGVSGLAQAAIHSDRDVRKKDIGNTMGPLIGNTIPAMALTQGMQSLVDE